MGNKQKLIMSLGAALAGLTPVGAQAAIENQPATHGEKATDRVPAVDLGQVNQLVKVGSNLLGFVVTQDSNGAVTAEHYSHTSHASHSSHQSHFSSR